MEEQFIYELTAVENAREKNLTLTQEKEKKDLPKYLEKRYINQMLDKCKDHKKKMLVLFLFRTGVRITEAINLTKKDINFDEGFMQVRWLKSRKYHKRTVPIHKTVLELLNLYTGPLGINDKLFDFSRQRAYQITKEVLNASPHQLRHSFAVHWLRSTGDIFILSRVLGHSRIQTTMEYLKIVPVDQRKELNNINFS